MIEFNIKGVKLRFTFLFFWFFTLLFLLDRSGILLYGLLAALIHEGGHILAFLLLHDRPEEISFEIGGIRMVRRQHPISVAGELFQLMMGSVTNLLVFFLLLFSLKTVSRLSMFAVSHLFLGLFNLLPITSLDGGKIVQLLLEQRLGIRTAYVAGKVLSIAICVFLALLGGYLYLTRQGGISLLLAGVMLGLSSLKA